MKQKAHSTISLSELARLSGYSRAHLHELAASGKLALPAPKPKGRYPRDGAVKALFAYQRSRINTGEDSLMAERRELVKVRGKEIEHRLAVEQKNTFHSIS